MPSSAIEGVQYIIEFIRRNKPDLRTVLDIGIGFGKFGYLLRDYFDAKEKHYFQPSEWKLKITGVDVFQGYLSDIQYKIYNKIIIGDIITVLPKLGHFDLAILSDVIEHFSKKKRPDST